MIPDFLTSAEQHVRALDGSEPDGLRIEVDIDGDLVDSRLVNEGPETVHVAEAALFAGRVPWSPETTRIRGEGFQKMSQYAGTMAEPVFTGTMADADHWKLPRRPDCLIVYNMLELVPAEADRVTLGFASCRRFSGEFHVFPDGRFEVALDMEGLAVAPGESLELDRLAVLTGTDREAVLERFAGYIVANHPLPLPDTPPSGWCSWYRYFAEVTERNILDNLDAVAERCPGLRYVQIDDGYEPFIGDWLDASDKFPSGMKALCERIRERGFEPAVWVGPFIAETDSRIFAEHPEFFMTDEDGVPLPSDRVSFGGWRNGPWYALDGTHPGACEWLEHVFRTMREEWGATYFKLDANAWGALHGARLHDPDATRIEAYRRGMAAVLRGAGEGSFVLGCNAPTWPSIGCVHGIRLTNDTGRRWECFAKVARELFPRNWMNGRIWWNDPDCVIVHDIPGVPNQQAPENEYRFHVTYILAAGGLVLSGDDMTDITDDRLEMLKTLLPPSGRAARFEDDAFRIGRIVLPERELVCCFNRTDDADRFDVSFDGAKTVRELWSGRDHGVREGSVGIDVPGRSAEVLVLEPT